MAANPWAELMSNLRFFPVEVLTSSATYFRAALFLQTVVLSPFRQCTTIIYSKKRTQGMLNIGENIYSGRNTCHFEKHWCYSSTEQIENKLKTLAQFNVTGAEAKRNATRSLARAAGVDPSALYKGSSTSIHVADVKEDGKWVTLKVKVVQIWDNTSDKITQTGLIGDETGIIKFTIWESANLPPMEEGRSYEIKSAVTNLYNEKFQDIQSGSGLIKRCPECNRKPFLQQKSFISL